MSVAMIRLHFLQGMWSTTQQKNNTRELADLNWEEKLSCVELCVQIMCNSNNGSKIKWLYVLSARWVWTAFRDVAKLFANFRYTCIM